MKVLKNKRTDNVVALQVEIAHSELEKAMEVSFKKVVKSAKVSGFRKGKVPRAIFEKHYGKESIIQEAIFDEVNNAYKQAIVELDLEIIDQPKDLNISEYKENEPVTFDCNVDVKPTVKLGKYKGLKVEKTPDTIEEDKVNEQIDRIRENYADYVETDRAISEDDVIRVKIEANIDETIFEEWTRDNVGVKLGLGTYGEDFDKEVVGLKKGENKTFTSEFKEDFQNKNVAGKTVSFSVTIEEVREKKLPELTDDFVKNTIKQYDSVENFKEAIRTQLDEQVKKESKNKLHDDLVMGAVENAKLEVQQVLVEREIDNSIRELEMNLKQSGMTIDGYLKMTGKNKDTVRDDFKESAEKRVKAELVLEAISETEEIAVSDDDIKNEIKEWKLPNINTDEEIDNYLKTINMDSIKSMVKSKKTLTFLEENAKIK